MPVTVKATVNLNALKHNLQQVRKLAPNSRVMAVIKADAYGHGLIESARALTDADALAVARVEEALQLREAGIAQRILLLSGALSLESIRLCAEHGIDIVVHTTEVAQQVCDASLAKPLTVWAKHDSGMHRLGFNDEAFRHAVTALCDSPNVTQCHYMTHFSSAEDPDPRSVDTQLERFHAAIDGLPASALSLSNSAAVIKRHGSGDHWVRPGIMLYGCNPLPTSEQTAHPCDLQPVMTLSAPVIALRTIAAGERVGYHGRWAAERDSVIATAAIGYGDGYPRHAPDGTPVLVNGQRAGLTGIVSMDLLSIDVTDCGPVALGDPVILWGRDAQGQTLKAEEVAEYAGTISYELLTQVSKRVPRFYG